ncbi:MULTISPECIES: GNAT family N-acetyltransferase [unclassified Sphingobacterium]|uniref:GNAT family N-acetyltransferase n=1 Tax=unclassified Sphingobacterium TaxID=2609468 RepID=UPI0025E575AF|nr:MULTISPECIES: GNAT family N-acetyltransferase [unclassified Sphingobacterium]
MNMKTERLNLRRLDMIHAAFMLRLVNTDQWKENIGDRNVNSIEEAEAYVRRIIETPTIQYWVVSLIPYDLPVGVVSLVKRTYLEDADIGFALLPEFEKQGYAFEAASRLLIYIRENRIQNKVLGITKNSNLKSIRLLEKLGMKRASDIEDTVQEQNELIYYLYLHPQL